MDITKDVCRRCKGRYCTTKISIFSVLQQKQLKEITDVIIRKEYKKGTMIFLEGDVSDKLYLITKGKIKIFRYTKEGKEQILYIMSEGDFVGDLSLLKKERFKFNAEALEDTKLCILTKEDFDRILKKNPEIALKILEVLYDRIVALEDSVQRLGTKDAESRLAGLLLSLIKDFGKPTDKGIELDIPLNREDMANYIGVTRETISRKLSSLQEEGIIEIVGNKKIIIKNLEELEYLS